MMRACIRCGSTTLEGEEATATCLACGNQGPAASFADRAALAEFQRARAALFKPTPEGGPDATASWSEGVDRRPRGWMRGVAAIVGFLFALGAVMSFFTAVSAGPDAVPLALSGLTALLFGVPFLMLARRR